MIKIGARFADGQLIDGARADRPGFADDPGVIPDDVRAGQRIARKLLQQVDGVFVTEIKARKQFVLGAEIEIDARDVGIFRQRIGRVEAKTGGVDSIALR